MATLLRNTSMEGNLVLPQIYGGSELAPGGSAIIADVPANVGAVMAGFVSSGTAYSLSQVPDGQAGAISPAISPALAPVTGQATVTGVATVTVASVAQASLKALTTYHAKAKVAGIGTQASSVGTKGKGLASELDGCFVTDNSSPPVPTQVGTTTSIMAAKDAALDAGDVPTLSVVAGKIAVQGIAAATEVIDYSAVIELSIAAT